MFDLLAMSFMVGPPLILVLGFLGVGLYGTTRRKATRGCGFTILASLLCGMGTATLLFMLYGDFLD